MRIRLLAAAAALALVPLSAANADAAVGPPRIQRLAEQQTELLYRFFKAGAPVSPADCGQGQDRSGVRGSFLLPTRSFNPGDTTQRCATTARSVFMDLGGAIATEDTTSTWEFADGSVVPFDRKHLESICQDVLSRGFAPSAAGTVDGRSITPVAVSTKVVVVDVNRKAGQPYTDSVTLGHPGRLAATFCGYKAEVPLNKGKHLVSVDYTPSFDAPSSVSTYKIRVG